MDIDTLYQQHASDPRPLPLIIAELWQFPLAHIEQDDVIWYAVQDWIAGVGQTENPRRFWAEIKSRVNKQGGELFASVEQLPYKAKNGRTYQMDYANAETLYYITQRMRAETGLRDKVLRYLAKAGVKLDEFRIDPGSAIEAGIRTYQEQRRDPEWIEARAQATIARTWFTAALQAALENPQPRHFMLASNEIYQGLWQRTAKQLKAELGLPERANLRDHQPTLALAYTRITEIIIAQKLGHEDRLTWTQAKEIITIVAGFIGSQARATGEIMGTDLATGKRLLGK